MSANAISGLGPEASSKKWMDDLGCTLTERIKTAMPKQSEKSLNSEIVRRTGPNLTARIALIPKEREVSVSRTI